jgi:CDP-L-myo-inositol myo-inositolphosphotransferase
LLSFFKSEKNQKPKTKNQKIKKLGKKMKAIIIAAGQGTRLKEVTSDIPKTTVKLLNLMVIERIIKEANLGGIDEFIIVGGYQYEILKEKIENSSLLKSLNIKIDFVYNEKYKEYANGYSVYKAKEKIKKDESFFVLMSDHLISKSIIKTAIKNPPKNGECKLVIDRNISDCFDIDDATKVVTENEIIIKMHKELKEYNALDTGIFFSTYNLFYAIEKGLNKNITSLTGANTELINEKNMKFIEKERDDFWFDVDTKESFIEAEKILTNKLIKKSDGFISRFINRRVSILITKFMLKTFFLKDLSPNLISYLCFIIGIISFYFLKNSNFIIGAILIQFVSILDGVDGEISRLNYKGTFKGAYLDWTLDRVIDLISFLGIYLGYIKLFGYNNLIFIFFILTIISSILYWTSEDLFVISGMLSKDFKDKKGFFINIFLDKLKKKDILLTMRRDVLLFIVFILLLFKKIFICFFIISVFRSINFLYKNLDFHFKKVF